MVVACQEQLGQFSHCLVGGNYNSKFLRGRPEKFRASIRIRAITFFFIYLCNLVGYWPICGLKLTYYSIIRTLNVIIGGCYNSKFLRRRPEKSRVSIRIRAITFFFISLCNLVGYWPICGLKLTYYSINRTLNVIIGGCFNSKFLRGRPEKFRASIRIRA